MNLKEYVEFNYHHEFGIEIPKSLSFLLENIFASKINLDEFRYHFSLENAEFLEILSFITDENNSYNLGRYGYNCYVISREDNKNRRKRTAFDSYEYNDSHNFTKRFK